VPLEDGAGTTALVYPAATAGRATLILGHGAGAGQLSAFMVEFARALSARGLDLVTFN
jgi:predicted alpha/beta-hydrolase family hydrolase